MAWEDTYREHPVWQASEELSTAMATVLSEEFPDPDVEQEMGRLDVLVTRILGHASVPHPTLSALYLDQVGTIIGQIQQHATAGTLETAVKGSRTSSNTLLNQLALQVRTWPVTGSASLQGLHRDVESLRRSLSGATEASRESVRDVEEAAKATQKELDDQFDALQAKLSEVNEAIEQVNTDIEQQAQRIDAAITNQHTAFNEAQDDRAEEWKTSQKLALDNLDIYLKMLDDHEREARKVVESVAVNSTAGRYLIYAAQQHTAANWWRIGAAFAFSIAALGFLTLVFLPYFGVAVPEEGQGLYQLVLQKLGAPIGVGLVGAYCANESRKHREQEHSAKQTDLTLTALEPFIANMPEKQQRVIRFETARRIFSQNNGYIDWVEVDDDV